MKKHVKTSKIAALLTAALFLSIAVTGCGPKESSMDFKAADGSYMITADSSWADKIDEIDQAETILYIYNPVMEKYIMVMRYAKADYGFASLDAYNGQVLPALLSAFNADTANSDKITVSGFNALQTKTVLDYEGHKFVCWIYSVETDTDYLTMMGYTLSDREDKYGEEIVKVMNSLKAQ